MKLPSLRYGDLQAGWIRNEEQDVAARGAEVVKKMTRTLFARAGKTCAPGDDSGLCEKPTDSTSTQTLPIVLGLVIPLSCAVVVFIVLHRRNKKKQALEDLHDPHKSLDFGFDMTAPPPVAKKKRGRRPPPEMINTDIEYDRSQSRSNHRPGLSMDVLGSPYLLPAGLSESRESFHSLTRSIRDPDPYRPVPFSRSSSETWRSQRPFNEKGSLYAPSIAYSGFNDRTNLVSNAQTISQSYPDRIASIARIETRSPLRQLANDDPSELPSRNSSPTSTERNLSERSETRFELPALPSPSPEPIEEHSSYLYPVELAAKELPAPPKRSSVSVIHPPRKESAGDGLQITIDGRPMSDSSSVRGDDPPPPPPKFTAEPEDAETPPPKLLVEPEEVEPPPPKFVEEPEELDYDIDPSMIYTGRYSIDNSAPSEHNEAQINRLSYLGVRPLPPDHPEENPEQRANRIRSFYKEYFDVNKPTPANAYYEDYDADYADYSAYDGWYDPESGGYYQPPSAPWAEPVARRAMTPPPRGVPRFDGGHDRHYSTMSGGRAPFRGRPPPKKQLPPPKALTSLPTPHLLKSDAALMNASDFAPPTSFRERQNGRRPDSPMGTERPFSPAVRAFSPLVSSFKGLAPIPSPHELRKSGTFTSLDFSPAPPRFRGFDSGASHAGSDAGSIRSARSGISAVQMDAVRHGAYRVSRIPKEFVTSKDDITTQLRPKWDLTTPA